MINWIEKIEELEPDFFDDMKECNHAWDEVTENPYHKEGSVWNHTLLVLQEADKFYPNDDIFRLGALLHDIAKPICMELIPDKKRRSFFNHESMGVFKAIGILKKLNIKGTDVVRVLEIIQRHADGYKLSNKNLQFRYNNETIEDVHKIRLCDTNGRICDDKPEVFDLELNEFQELPKYDRTITLLIGPPASGKSTYLENYHGLVLSRDNCIMDSVNTDNYSEAWNLVNQKEIDKLFQERLKNMLNSNKDFIVDMTNMTVKSRKKWFNLKSNVDAIVFITDYNVLQERNKNRLNKTLKPYIIDNMCKQFQLPYLGEGFRNIEYKF